MRLFVAAYPPPEVTDHLGAYVDRLRIGQAAAAGINVRRAGAVNVHVTVAFLGEVADDRLPDVQAALDRAARSWRTPPGRARRRAGPAAAEPVPADPGASVPEVRLRLAGGGRFGRGGFTVLWVGLDGEVAALHQVSRSVRAELKRIRVPYDRRLLRPHLTIARPGERLTPPAIAADLAELARYVGPWWPLADLMLVRSHLGPHPTYDRLGSWPL